MKCGVNYLHLSPIPIQTKGAQIPVGGDTNRVDEKKTPD